MKHLLRGEDSVMYSITFALILPIAKEAIQHLKESWLNPKVTCNSTQTLTTMTRDFTWTRAF